MAYTAAQAIRDGLASTALYNRQGDHANIVDVAADVSTGVTRIADAITPRSSCGIDASQRYISSLTEAVMGTTAGLFAIANAIDNLAQAVRERKD